MAGKKQYAIEIKLNQDAELGTAILFFQKLIRLMAKFGVTYFKTAVIYGNDRELARYETAAIMSNEIMDFHEDKMREEMVKRDTEGVTN